MTQEQRDKYEAVIGLEVHAQLLTKRKHIPLISMHTGHHQIHKRAQLL